MLNFFKNNTKNKKNTDNKNSLQPSDSLTEKKNTEQKTKKQSYFSKLSAGLSKTGEGFRSVFLGKKTLDNELLEDIETALLISDIGIELTEEIINHLTQSLKRKELKDTQEVIQNLKTQMMSLLVSVNKPLVFESNSPFVLLMVGINGAGKTTTIGKITQQLKSQGKSVMLAAGDTFRAAATEQLNTWGERTDSPVISQGTGADAASVIFDAYQSAKAKQIDVLIADTAGRLHTQSHLMSEIEKIVRVLKKTDPTAPHEVMLVIDAGNGQNALNQAIEFNKSLNLTGITITKLDGTAKGGIIFPIAKKLNVPIRFIGIGEGVEDLRQFDSKQFVEALLSNLET